MPPHVPDVIRMTMEALTNGLRTILGDQLVGVYVGGSVAMGDFDEHSSDVDFLVVTENPLSMEDAIAVQLLHRDLLKRYPAASLLLGDYAPRASLTPEGTTEPVPGCEQGVFLPRVGEIVLTSDVLWCLREYGIRFYGPDIREVIPAISAEHVRRAAVSWLNDGPGMPHSPREAAGAVLNLVRSAYAMETGAATTKSGGASWALRHLDTEWHPVIQAALAVRSGRSTAEDAHLIGKSLPRLDHFIRARYC